MANAEDSDEEDFHFFGTPLDDERETRGFRKAVKVQGTTRSLPVWQQEVTDEQGRKRFHGAFTGGFSAGHYNTVGSVVSTPTDHDQSAGLAIDQHTQEASS